MSKLGNPIISAAYITDSFSGDGSTKSWVMSVAPANSASVLVAITGALQDPSTYSVVGTTITFSGTPPIGTGNISVRYLGIPATGIVSTAYRTVTEVIATAGQTVFTIPSYTVGFLNVYVNGSRLANSDFTAVNGVSVTLTDAAALNDVITTESFYVSSVLNAIRNSTGSVLQTNLANGIAGTGPSFSAYGTAVQTLPQSVATKIAFNTEEFDTSSSFDPVNYRFTPNVPGYYQLTATVTSGGSVNGPVKIDIYKNGSLYRMGTYAVGPNVLVAGLCVANGTTDYFEIYATQNSSGSMTVGSQGVAQSFSGFLARALTA